MRLVDTGIWIDHLREPDPALFNALDGQDVLTHAYVQGELALGNLGRRGLTFMALLKLPEAIVAKHEEVMELITRRSLHSSGIGYVDAHLVASVLLTPYAKLWTRDRKLAVVADRLGILA